MHNYTCHSIQRNLSTTYDIGSQNHQSVFTLFHSILPRPLFSSSCSSFSCAGLIPVVVRNLLQEAPCLDAPLRTQSCCIRYSESSKGFPAWLEEIGSEKCKIKGREYWWQLMTYDPVHRLPVSSDSVPFQQIRWAKAWSFDTWLRKRKRKIWIPAHARTKFVTIHIDVLK